MGCYLQQKYCIYGKKLKYEGGSRVCWELPSVGALEQ